MTQRSTQTSIRQVKFTLTFQRDDSDRNAAFWNKWTSDRWTEKIRKVENQSVWLGPFHSHWKEAGKLFTTLRQVEKNKNGGDRTAKRMFNPCIAHIITVCARYYWQDNCIEPRQRLHSFYKKKNAQFTCGSIFFIVDCPNQKESVPARLRLQSDADSHPFRHKERTVKSKLRVNRLLIGRKRKERNRIGDLRIQIKSIWLIKWENCFRYALGWDRPTTSCCIAFFVTLLPHIENEAKLYRPADVSHLSLTLEPKGGAC